MGHYWTLFGFFTDLPELRRAQYWYFRAANKGDKEAMFHLAWVDQQIAMEEAPVRTFKQVTDDLNKGITQKPADLFDVAMEWYKKSAEMGFAPAMNNLAVMYKYRSEEQGGYRDLSYKWRLAAANAGNPMSTIAMYATYKTGDGVEENSFYADNWKYWDPKKSDSRDILSPTLERTALYGMVADEALYSQIRNAAKEGKPAILLQDISKFHKKPDFEQINRQYQEPN